MAKSNFRFAVPSQLDSDDEGSDGQNAEHSGTSSKFKPGQMFAQKKTDNTVTSTKPAETSKATVTSLPANLSGCSSTASAPSSASASRAPFTATIASSSATPTVPTAQSSASSAPSAVRSGADTKNAIIVNPKQRGNPILKHVNNVAYEYGDIAADYQVGSTSCVLYLSLRYHNLNPDYIQKRLDDLRNMYELRVLLAQVDVKDPHHSLKELALLCILTNFTLIVAWSTEEAGRYLETYKIYENKPPDAIMSRPEGDFQGQVADALTTVKGVNKTDATTLLTTFDSFANIVQADEEKLLLCPGLGPLKAKRLHQLFETPFTNWK